MCLAVSVDLINIKLMVLSLHSQSDQTRGHGKPLSDSINKPFIFNDFFALSGILIRKMLPVGGTLSSGASTSFCFSLLRSDKDPGSYEILD